MAGLKFEQTQQQLKASQSIAQTEYWQDQNIVAQNYVGEGASVLILRYLACGMCHIFKPT
jgi:hypothetical protein